MLVHRVPEPRQATFGRIKDPAGDETIDDALVLWFPGPKSETGEDLAELQLHGGQAIIAATMRALGDVPGFRLAEGGEFTRRAFENGKLDLTAVEGLADLIGAETEAQRRQAYRQLAGLLGNRAETWRARLIEALALVEARIDFADEDGVPENLLAPAMEIARALRSEIVAALDDGRRGERLRDGLTIAIAGPPNAGKSSLINWIARRDVAIVTAVPGTTRDVIEVQLDLGGYPVTLLDTAGIRDAVDPVEQEGVRRALARTAEADLVLWITDASEGAGPNSPAVQSRAAGQFWKVYNKIDLMDSVPKSTIPGAEEIESSFSISCRTGSGIRRLLDRLSDFAQRELVGDSGLITRERHRYSLAKTADFLARALACDREELVAEELRSAAQELGRLTGRVDVEDVLERIFKDFCIGK